MREGRLDVVGGLDEFRIGLGDLLFVADVAERVEQVRGAHQLRDRRLGDFAPLGRQLEPRLGEIQKLTPACDALYVTDIDSALDDEASKREFWAAFRTLGEWYSEFPPY